MILHENKKVKYISIKKIKITLYVWNEISLNEEIAKNNAQIN